MTLLLHVQRPADFGRAVTPLLTSGVENLNVRSCRVNQFPTFVAGQQHRGYGPGHQRPGTVRARRLEGHQGRHVSVVWDSDHPSLFSTTAGRRSIVTSRLFVTFCAKKNFLVFFRKYLV